MKQSSGSDDEHRYSMLAKQGVPRARQALTWHYFSIKKSTKPKPFGVLYPLYYGWVQYPCDSKLWSDGFMRTSNAVRPTNPPGYMHASPMGSRKRLQAASIGCFPKENPSWIMSGPTHAHTQLHSPLLSQEPSLCCLHQGSISLYGLPVTLQRDKQSF